MSDTSISKWQFLRVSGEQEIGYTVNRLDEDGYDLVGIIPVVQGGLTTSTLTGGDGSPVPNISGWSGYAFLLVFWRREIGVCPLKTQNNYLDLD